MWWVSSRARRQTANTVQALTVRRDGTSQAVRVKLTYVVLRNANLYGVHKGAIANCISAMILHYVGT